MDHSGRGTEAHSVEVWRCLARRHSMAVVEEEHASVVVPASEQQQSGSC